MLKTFIYKNYGWLTIEEFEMAIDLCAMGRLHPNNNSFYFTANYVGTMLTLFRSFLIANVQRLAERRGKYKGRPAGQVAVPEQVSESIKHFLGIKNHIKYEYELFKKTGEIDVYNSCYDFLYKSKRLILPKGRIGEAVKWGMERAVKEMNDVSTGIRQAKASYVAKPEDTLVKNFARNYCVQKYFETVDIEELLASITEKEFEPPKP